MHPIAGAAYQRQQIVAQGWVDQGSSTNGPQGTMTKRAGPKAAQCLRASGVDGDVSGRQIACIPSKHVEQLIAGQAAQSLCDARPDPAPSDERDGCGGALHGQRADAPPQMTWGRGKQGYWMDIMKPDTSSSEM